MALLISDTLFWFSITFTVMLLAAFIMRWQSQYFYTNIQVVIKFNILDLQFAASAKKLVSIINGIYELPPPDKKSSLPESKEVVKALKGYLWVGSLLFMPAAYGSVFLMCMKMAYIMYFSNRAGFQPISFVFSLLAWLQIVAFLLNVVENIYLLRKIKPSCTASSRKVHHAFRNLEAYKWGIALTGATGGVSASLYFWLSGIYSEESVFYLWVLITVALLFIISIIVVSKKANLNKVTN